MAFSTMETLYLSHWGTRAANLELGEVGVRFGKYFEIKELERKTNSRGWPKGSATYLLTRK